MVTEVERLLVVSCPDLLEVDEGGEALRSFAEVIGAVEAYCPWVTAVRPGICSLPARGPARYFGGERALIRSIAAAASPITPVEVGVADGLFAAVLAARDGRVVPPGGTPRFLAPFAVEVLGNPELAELLARLGIRTLGDFAELPESHVLGRFGADGVWCHQLARGRSGELAGLRRPTPGRRNGSEPDEGVTATRPRPASGVGRATRRPGRRDRSSRCRSSSVPRASSARVSRVGGDRPNRPASSPGTRTRVARASTSPPRGPGGSPHRRRRSSIPPRSPPNSPAGVGSRSRFRLAVSSSATPARLSVEGGPWTTVTAWAGPWPSEERWWSRSRRRSARLQAVTAAGPGCMAAYLLLVERGRWWVEATYG